jgi:hypothetical protein
MFPNLLEKILNILKKNMTIFINIAANLLKSQREKNESTEEIAFGKYPYAYRDS